jgi:AAA ATPase domain
MSSQGPRFPFHVGSAIQNPKEFVGREQLLIQLYDAMAQRQSVSLHGERRTGKTSLLRRLAAADPQLSQHLPATCVPVYFDFQKYSSAPAADIWRALSEAIGRETRARRPDQTEAALRFLAEAAAACAPGAHPQVIGADVGQALGHLRAAELLPVLLLDEFEQTALNPELGPRLYDTLRSLTGEAGGLMYIVATRTGLGKLQQDVREASYRRISSPFFNIFTRVDLPCFNDEEAIELLYRYFGQAGREFLALAERLSADLGFLFDQTGFHPFFLQALCYHLCQHLNQPEWPHGLARAAALQTFIRDAEEHFAYYWDVSDPAEQRMMSQLARGQALDTDEPATRNNLLARCLIIAGQDKTLRLFAEGFRDWVSRTARKPTAASAILRTETFRQQIATRSTYEVLDSYLIDHEGLLTKAQLEWRMAGRALEEPPSSSTPPAFPPDLLGRPSGAMLLWIIQQHLRIPSDLPGVLASLPSLTKDQARLFVRGWALWPENPRLIARLDAIVMWLTVTPTVLGGAVPLLARVGSYKLAIDCARRWLTAAPSPHDLAATLPDLLHVPELRDYGREALRWAIVINQGDRDMLRRLCGIAFEHQANQEASSAVSLLMLASDQPYDPELGAIQIAANAAIGAHNTAIRLYEEYWYHSSQPINFPYPQYLLPALSRYHATHLRTHLLRHCDRSTSVPIAVRLEAMTVGQRPELAAAIWARLTSRSQSSAAGQAAPTLYLLLQTTEACIRAGNLATPARRYAFDRWQAMLAASDRQVQLPAMVRLAAAATVLLDTDNHRQIACFRRHLLQTPLHESDLVQRAARAYLLALVRQHEWNVAARFIEREDFAYIRAHCLPTEYEWFQLLKTYTLRSQRTMQDSLHLWETWICMALPDHLVCMAMDHVAETLAQPDLDDTATLVTIVPHVLRRGRALGERLLRDVATTPIHQQLGAHLAETTITTIGSLLQTIMRNTRRR